MEKLKDVTIAVLLAVGFLAVPSVSFAENPMRITTEENVVSICEGRRVLLDYRYRDVPFKPYVQRLFSPQGVNVLRDAPADHLHHHALMFAVAVDGVNFWEEHKEAGRQVHRRLGDVKIDKPHYVPHAAFTERLDWVNPRSEELLLKERRTVEVCRLNEPEVTLLGWQSEFELPPGKESVTLTGSHYFGLGMRFVKSMDTGGEFRNASGKTGDVVRGSEQLVRSPWCAYTADANGKPVTVAMFGDPGNLRHPALWFNMTEPFAYLAATLNLHKEPLKITSDKPLVLRYAVALWDGRVENNRIDQVYRWWTKNK
jgi:hypothetical protein